jgi:hypothetical protein
MQKKTSSINLVNLRAKLIFIALLNQALYFCIHLLLKMKFFAFL